VIFHSYVSLPEGNQANCQYPWVDGGPCFAGDADNDLDEPCDNMFFLTELFTVPQTMLRCACIGWSGVGWGGLITFIRLRSSVCIFQYALEATLLTWSSNFQHDLDAMLLAGSWNFLYDLDATLLTFSWNLVLG